MLWPGLLGTLQLSNWRMRLRHGLVPVSGGCARGKLHWSMPSKIAALTCTCQHAGNCFQRIEWYSLHFQNDCSGHGACTMDHAGAGKCVCDTGYRSGLASLPRLHARLCMLSLGSLKVCAEPNPTTLTCHDYVFICSCSQPDGLPFGMPWCSICERMPWSWCMHG